MNEGKDLEPYKLVMERDKKEIIAFKNIDNRVNADIFGRQVTKFVSTEQLAVMNSIHGVTEKEMIEGTEEIFLDFRGEENKEVGKLEIKVKDRRKQYPALAGKLKDVDAKKSKYNVLNLFVDTVSRGRFYRRFPQTIQFLTNLKNKKNSPARVYDFFKFHSIRGYTFANLLASTYGLDAEKSRDQIYEKQVRIERLASQDGYITGLSSDICQVSEQDAYRRAKLLVKTFDDDYMPDHVFNQIGCDYNFYPKKNAENPLFGKGPWTMNKKCFMRRDITEM